MQQTANTMTSERVALKKMDVRKQYKHFGLDSSYAHAQFAISAGATSEFRGADFSTYLNFFRQGDIQRRARRVWFLSQGASPSQSSWANSVSSSIEKRTMGALRSGKGAPTGSLADRKDEGMAACSRIQGSRRVKWWSYLEADRGKERRKPHVK